MTRKARPEPTAVPFYTSRDVSAIKALAAGTATAEQQKEAIAWIVHRAAETDEQAYRSEAEGGDRATCVELGKRHVGRMIRHLVDLPGALLDALRQSERKEGHD